MKNGFCHRVNLELRLESNCIMASNDYCFVIFISHFVYSGQFRTFFASSTDCMGWLGPCYYSWWAQSILVMWAYVLFITPSFHWNKQPRLIWKPLSFPSEPLKVMLQFEPSDFLYSARVDSFPAEWKYSRSATLRNWRVSCWSEWLTDCTQLLHYVFMLC